jgi:hypothetical protein
METALVVGTYQNRQQVFGEHQNVRLQKSVTIHFYFAVLALLVQVFKRTTAPQDTRVLFAGSAILDTFD